MFLRHCFAAFATVIVVAGACLLGPVAPSTASVAFAHWDQRSLVVSDRTGDAGWQLATSRAVAVWNAVGADVRLTWVAGGVGCVPEGTTIPVCRDRLRPGWKGATAIVVGADGHLVSARIRVALRAFTQAQQDTIACHEIGHALGLDHSRSAASCLTQGSLSRAPDGEDAAALRAAYGHPRHGH